jgi:hypothetical protein
VKIIGYATEDGRFMPAAVFAAWSAHEPEQAGQFKPVMFVESTAPLTVELTHIAESGRLPDGWAVGGEVQDWAAGLLKKLG